MEAATDMENPQRHGRAPGRGALAAADRWLGHLVEIPAALLVLAEVLVLLTGVVSRYVLHHPVVWSDELASILFLWLAMLGAVVAFRRGEHMRMTAFVGKATPQTREIGRASCRERVL